MGPADLGTAPELWSPSLWGILLIRTERTETWNLPKCPVVHLLSSADGSETVFVKVKYSLLKTLWTSGMCLWTLPVLHMSQSFLQKTCQSWYNWLSDWYLSSKELGERRPSPSSPTTQQQDILQNIPGARRQSGRSPRGHHLLLDPSSTVPK